MTLASAQTRLVRLLQILLLVSASVYLNTLSFADDRGPLIPPASKGEQCVADTDFMRRNHMQLLTHQRDDTVLRGIREEPFSLAECVDCHAQTQSDGRPVRVDAEGQFCQSCHTYAAVKIDCFGCHAAVPDQAALQLPPIDKDVSSHSHPKTAALMNLATFRYGNFENK